MHTSSNFTFSISLLKIFDTLLLRPSLHCNTPLHFTTLHPITLHYTSLHFTTFHSTTLHYTLLHFTTFHPTTLHYTPLHFTTFHPTTLHYTSLHFTQLHFTTLIDTSLPLIYTSLPFHLALRIMKMKTVNSFETSVPIYHRPSVISAKTSLAQLWKHHLTHNERLMTTYLLTPWSRVLLEKLTSKLCS